jgi:pyruvate-formate lyase-activating enzyme
VAFGDVQDLPAWECQALRAPGVKRAAMTFGCDGQMVIISGWHRALRYNSTVSKFRRTTAGIHLFDRNTGINVLVTESDVEHWRWSLAPRQISVALTNACDLRCPYCYAPKVSSRLRDHQLLSWLVDLDQNGCLGVGFGGGEPTLLRELPALCRRVASETELAVTFTSHGHHLDADLCAKLEGAVHFVRISMDGVGATYERLRKRSFSALLDRLADVAKIAPFGINYVVNSETIADLDSAAHIAAAAGARELLLLPEQPTTARPGIDSVTSTALREWIIMYHGPLMLSVSVAGADGLPVCVPIIGETQLEAYAHIDAQGVLKKSSYDSHGVLIGGDGVMAALAILGGESGALDEGVVGVRLGALNEPRHDR